MLKTILAGLVLSASAVGDPLAERNDHYFNLEYDEAIASYERACHDDPLKPTGSRSASSISTLNNFLHLRSFG